MIKIYCGAVRILKLKSKVKVYTLNLAKTLTKIMTKVKELSRNTLCSIVVLFKTRLILRIVDS